MNYSIHAAFLAFLSTAALQVQAQDVRHSLQDATVVMPKSDPVTVEGVDSQQVRTRKAVINAGPVAQVSSQNKHAQKMQASAASNAASVFSERGTSAKQVDPAPVNSSSLK